METPSKLSKDFDAADVEAQELVRHQSTSDSSKDAKVQTWGARLKRLFTPEFVHVLHKPSPPLRDTAYLDGIRGVAAFIVYLAHNLLSANHLFTPLEVAWGFEGKNHHLINFPFLRLFFTGSHVAVPIFFVISGYVQARKPLRQIRDGEDICGTLASAIFRRPFRMYIPVIGSTFSFMVLWHLLGVTPTLNHHEPTFLADLCVYLGELWHWTYLFRSKNKGYFTDHQKVQEAWFAYNGHTWTIPIELQGSILLLLVILTLSRTTVKKRITMTLALAIYFLIHGSCYTFTFLAGSAIADIHASTLWLAPSTKTQRYLFYGLFLLGIYLGTPPAQGLLYMSSATLATHPGFWHLSKLVPWVYYDAIHFLVSIGSVAILCPIIALPRLQTLFTGRVVQYLGRLSFAIYLVHGPIIETLGQWCYSAVGKLDDAAATLSSSAGEGASRVILPVPKIGPLGFDLPFLIANLVILPVTLYAAEICMKVFDKGSVWVARVAYESIL